MDYPEYVEIENKKYKINTDFRIAIKCNEISMDETIGDNERGLAIIFLLFGEEGLNDRTNHTKLVEYAIKFLSCGMEDKIENSNQEPDMDFSQDIDYIEASFMSDYKIDLSNEKMHWWKFYKLINGLSNSETGNCCILNRVRNLRNYDLKEIKDSKKRKEIEKAQKMVALKKKNKKEFTQEEENNINEFLSKIRKE